MKDYRGTCLTRHYIRADAVEAVVEMELRRLAEYLVADENRFAEILARRSIKQVESEKKTVQSELRKSEMRIEIIPKLLKTLYEDKLSGKTSEDNYCVLSQEYSDEREQLQKKILKLRRKLTEMGEKENDREEFIHAIRKFMEMRTLTKQVLNELIDHIDVYETQGTGKNKTQRLVIYYKFVGYLDIDPTQCRPNYTADIREGVAIEYISCEPPENLKELFPEGYGACDDSFNGEHNMFSGLLVCADCGSNLHFHFNQGNPEIKYFNCSNYKGNRGTCTSTHYVRVDFLEEVVLGEIRRLTKFASLYEDEFVKAVIGHSQQAEQTDRKLKEKELRTLLARDEELDGLFERIYEDNVSGKLSDDRFAKMSRRYEDEQKALAEKIKKLRSEIEKQSSRSMTTDMFIGLVRKYTRARKLTPRMLNELIEKIEVFNAEKIDGVWEQRLRIHYNCVGTIEIPTVLPLPIPEVSVNTRKGVVVNYAPCELAV